MRATRYHVCVLACFLLLSCCTLHRATGEMAGPPARAGGGHRGHQHHHHTKQKSARYRALPGAREADRSMEFMLDLYRRAAGPDGRPKEHRRFGSNTVRLLRPSSTIVRSQSAFSDLRYTFSVQYDLRGLPLDRLTKASFVHLRSSAPGLPALPIRARVTYPVPKGPSLRLLPGAPVVLGPPGALERNGHLRLAPPEAGAAPGPLRPVLERLAGPGEAGGGRRPPEDGGRDRGEGGISGRHLNPPALLLYLEEDDDEEEGGRGAEIRGWAAGETAGGATEGRPRVRRSKDPAGDRPALKEQENCSSAAQVLLSSSSSSSSSASSSSSPGTIMLEIPNYKRKGATARNQCKLHSYKVSFQQLGWDHYIIAPHRYNPHFCRGDCPRVLRYGYNSPNHAVVQTLISEMGAGEVPAPSCVPHRYKPQSVLILDKNKNVVYKEFEDMVAESCTCR